MYCKKGSRKVLFYLLVISQLIKSSRFPTELQSNNLIGRTVNNNFQETENNNVLTNEQPLELIFNSIPSTLTSFSQTEHLTIDNRAFKRSYDIIKTSKQKPKDTKNNAPNLYRHFLCFVSLLSF